MPTTGENEVFKNSDHRQDDLHDPGRESPQPQGIERVIDNARRADDATLDELGKSTKLKGGWIVGGYLSNWVTDALKLPKAFKVVQDILPNKLTSTADALLPAAAWAEKDGCWENFAGKIQPFAAADRPAGWSACAKAMSTQAARPNRPVQRRRHPQGNGRAVRVGCDCPMQKRDEPAFEFVEL